MKSSCNLGSPKMAAVLDQTDVESNSGNQTNFNILQILDKGTEYSIQDQNFTENIQLEVVQMDSGEGAKEGSSSQTEDGKRDWNLNYDILQSDKSNNFSCSDPKGKENDALKDKDESSKKPKKKGKQNVKSSVNTQTNGQSSSSGNPVNSQDDLQTKQLKTKQTGNMSKKSLDKLKEKIKGIKKGYKPIAPYPSVEEKITIVHNPVHKVLTSQLNPILIVKIDEPKVAENKGNVQEYFDYSDKNLENSEFINVYNFESSNQNIGADLKNKKNFITKTKCFKCNNCSFMTLNKDLLNYHFQKKEKCSADNEVFHCPGCKNVFFSLTPLRVHLVHDHRIRVKEARVILQNIQEVRLDVEKEKSLCVFDGNNQNNQLAIMSGDMFSSAIPAIELPLTGNREEIGKSLCNMSNRVNPRGLETYGGEKRQTMLESYLDDINNKGDCNLPPTLTHNGSALLENTFNFTAPVSEQLPSIQPPPAHSASTALLDQTHLIVEQNNEFIALPNVFDSRDQANQSNETPQFTDETNIILANGNFLSSHIQDIPVISLEDSSNLEKTSENILSQEINIEDFPSYQENEPGALEANENDGPMPVGNEDQEDQEDQEEKKKLKKLGVGYRCDINGCKVRLQSEKNIQYHRRCHEGTLYNCPECCRDCSTWISLSGHLWQAHKIDMELYKCDLCPYKTPSYSRLTNIHRGIHGKTRPFLCDVCGKGFKTVKQMRNHKNIHKAKMVRMSACHCDICGRTVADKRQLELHINNTHKKKKPYLCYICGYASAVKHSLVVHMRRHTGEKPYACEKCDYKSADHNALRRHKMKHSGVRSYKCNHCSYTCIQASTYKVHIKTKHPGFETDVIFSCTQCNFQTLNRGTYLSHTSEHENFNRETRKTGSTEESDSKAEMTTTEDYYSETSRMDFVGPIISERVVETIVDLSGAQSLLEPEGYYDVENITGELEEGQELKFKTSAIT